MLFVWPCWRERRFRFKWKRNWSFPYTLKENDKLLECTQSTNYRTLIFNVTGFHCNIEDIWRKYTGSHSILTVDLKWLPTVCLICAILLDKMLLGDGHRDWRNGRQTTWWRNYARTMTPTRSETHVTITDRLTTVTNHVYALLAACDPHERPPVEPAGKACKSGGNAAQHDVIVTWRDVTPTAAALRLDLLLSWRLRYVTRKTTLFGAILSTLSNREHRCRPTLLTFLSTVRVMRSRICWLKNALVPHPWTSKVNHT